MMCTTEIKAVKKDATFSLYNILKPHYRYRMVTNKRLEYLE